MIGIILGLAVGGIGGMLYGWRMGYLVGQIDADCGQSQCWPWSEATNRKGGGDGDD